MFVSVQFSLFDCIVMADIITAICADVGLIPQHKKEEYTTNILLIFRSPRSDKNLKITLGIWSGILMNLLFSKNWFCPLPT